MIMPVGIIMCLTCNCLLNCSVALIKKCRHLIIIPNAVFFFLQQEKPSTPVSKSATPTSSGSATPGPSSGLKPVAKPPLGKCPCKLLFRIFQPFLSPPVCMHGGLLCIAFRMSVCDLTKNR